MRVCLVVLLAELVEVLKYLNKYLKRGWIHPSMLPYGAPVLFVYKKEGMLKMCIDFSPLNEQIKLNAYPISRINDIFDRQSA